MPPLPNYTLRPASALDWPAIEALLLSLKLPTEGAADHLATFVLAEQGAQLVGCAGAEVYPAASPGPVALLRSVAVAPGLQQRGLGQALVSLMLEQARQRGIHSVHLLTVTAPEYFARFGFKRGPREHAPPALMQSAEFQGACPACAAFMSLPLAAASPAHQDLPVAVIGAGPVGLAAAAHLMARGLQPLILEAGAGVGTHLLDHGHVRLFSPWRYNLDAAMRGQLEASGWQAPRPDDLPLAREVVEKVLRPFAALPAVAQALHLRTRVLSISRLGFDKAKTSGREQAPFVIRAERDGQAIEFLARQVIDASGTWSQPNPLGAQGLPAEGEAEAAAAGQLFYGIPDVLGSQRARYAGQRTLVAGSGHSAAHALLALAELADSEPETRLVWAVRGATATRAFGGGPADALPARGQLGAALRTLGEQGRVTLVTGLRITRVRRTGASLTVTGLTPQGGLQDVEGIDQVIVATGQRPDLRLSGELRLRLDPALECTEALGPLIDPNVHSCGTVRPHGHRELSHPEPGFYTLGVKSYGRAPTFLMATGFEQARSVAAALAGDPVAADRVALDLPATGVCGLGEGRAAAHPAAAAPDGGGGCCNPSLADESPSAPAAAQDGAAVAPGRTAKAPCCG